MRRIRKFCNHVVRLFREHRCLRSVKSHEGQIFVGGKTQLTKNTILHFNPNFNGLIVKGMGRLEIGDNFHSGEDCLIITENHNYNNGTAIPYDNTYIYKDVNICENVWLGDRVLILGGTTIGEGAIIQAGSVVVKDIPPLAIAGGNPAKVFAYRNKEHYYLLKKQRKFS